MQTDTRQSNYVTLFTKLNCQWNYSSLPRKTNKIGQNKPESMNCFVMKTSSGGIDDGNLLDVRLVLFQHVWQHIFGTAWDE